MNRNRDYVWRWWYWKYICLIYYMHIFVPFFLTHEMFSYLLLTLELWKKLNIPLSKTKFSIYSIDVALNDLTWYKNKHINSFKNSLDTPIFSEDQNHTWYQFKRSNHLTSLETVMILLQFALLTPILDKEEQPQAISYLIGFSHRRE